MYITLENTYVYILFLYQLRIKLPGRTYVLKTYCNGHFVFQLPFWVYAGTGIFRPENGF